MEDVLEVYCQPYDPSVPRICMDEMGKNAGHQTSIPPNPPNRDRSSEKTTPTRKKDEPTYSSHMSH